MENVIYCYPPKNGEPAAKWAELENLRPHTNLLRMGYSASTNHFVGHFDDESICTVGGKI